MLSQDLIQKEVLIEVYLTIELSRPKEIKQNGIQTHKVQYRKNRKQKDLHNSFFKGPLDPQSSPLPSELLAADYIIEFVIGSLQRGQKDEQGMK